MHVAFLCDYQHTEKNNIVYVISIFHLQKYVFLGILLLPNSGYFGFTMVSNDKNCLPILVFFC